MAVLKWSAGFGGGSGRLGNVVLAQYGETTILRDRPTARRRRSAKEVAIGSALARVNRAWDALASGQADAWRAYGAAEGRKGYSAFVALGSKYLQLHGGDQVPGEPPTEPFLGDVVRVAIAGGPEGVAFEADRANALGMATELLAQRLTGPNNAPKADGYRTQGFATFADGALGVEVELSRGPYALAYRFVEAGTGRMGAILPLGRVTVG